MARDRNRIIKKYLRKRSGYYDNEIWEETLQNHYNISGPCADVALHNTTCFWHIVEEKGQDISKAMKQIENTYSNLKGKAIICNDGKTYPFKVQYFLIIASNLKRDRARWKRSVKGHFLTDNRRRKKVVTIDGIPVRLLYHNIIHGKQRFPEDFDKTVALLKKKDIVEYNG